MRSKFITFLFVFTLSLSLSIGIEQVAAAEVTDAGGTGNTDVTLETGAPKIFSVIIPDEIPVRMYNDGSVYVPGNLVIENQSSDDVQVTNIQVNGKNGWTVKDYSTDFSGKATGTKELGFSFRGNTTTNSGAITITKDNWVIERDATLAIQPRVKLPKQEVSSKSSIATVVWTLDWADNSDAPIVPPVSETTSVTAGIDWTGVATDKRPIGANIKLLKDGTEYATATLNEAGGWKHTWNDLPVNKDNGSKIVWTVDLVSVPADYEYSSKVNADGSITITVIYNEPEPETTSLTARVNWANDDEGKRPTSLSINLLKDGAVYDTAILDSSGGWSHTWTDLLVNNEDGSKIVWTMEVASIPENYTINIVTNADGSITITSTYEEPAPETISLTTNISWANDDASKRPASLSLQLLKDGAVHNTVTVNAANSWSYTWNDLLKYNDDGSEIVWAVSQTSVPENYTPTNTVNPDGSITVTYTYEEPIVTTIDVDYENGLMLPGATNIATFHIESNAENATLSNVVSMSPNIADVSSTDRVTNVVNGDFPVQVVAKARGTAVFKGTTNTGETATFNVDVSELDPSGEPTTTLKNPDSFVSVDALTPDDVIVEVPVINSDGSKQNYQVNNVVISSESNGGNNPFVINITINGVLVESPVEISMVDYFEYDGRWITGFSDLYLSIPYSKRPKDIILPGVEDIGSSVNAVQSSAFANCAWLKTLTIPDNYTSLSTTIVKGCSNIEVYLDKLSYNDSRPDNPSTCDDVTWPRVFFHNPFTGCKAVHLTDKRKINGDCLASLIHSGDTPIYIEGELKDYSKSRQFIANYGGTDRCVGLYDENWNLIKYYNSSNSHSISGKANIRCKEYTVNNYEFVVTGCFCELESNHYKNWDKEYSVADCFTKFGVCYIGKYSVRQLCTLDGSAVPSNFPDDIL